MTEQSSFSGWAIVEMESGINRPLILLSVPEGKQLLAAEDVDDADFADSDHEALEDF